MNQYQKFNEKQTKFLKGTLGITRNITNVFELEVWLLPFITIKDVQYYLRIDTVMISSACKMIQPIEIPTMEENSQPQRVYYRYNYMNLETESVFGNEAFHLSKIDAILYILMEIMEQGVTDIPYTTYQNLINLSDLAENFFSKKNLKLDYFKQTAKIQKEYRNTIKVRHYFFESFVDTILPAITYQHTDVINPVYEYFRQCEEVGFKNFNLYQITEKHITENRKLFNDLSKSFDKSIYARQPKTAFLKKYSYCSSGMNIYYVDACLLRNN